MVAYTKEEEDFIFDVWKSVRKQDKETGVLESSSNRQRYIKVFQAYKNHGFTHTYSQIETKLKKHRATFIKFCAKFTNIFSKVYENKEEEDFIFDVWKSVRKYDKETGVLVYF